VLRCSSSCVVCEKENSEITCYEAAAGTLGAKESSVKIYSCEEDIDKQELLWEDSDRWCCN
jgi:hypothetical protein